MSTKGKKMVSLPWSQHFLASAAPPGKKIYDICTIRAASRLAVQFSHQPSRSSLPPLPLYLQQTHDKPLQASKCSILPAVPHASNLGVAHLALELEDAVHERLTGRRASGDVNVDGNDAVAATDNAVAVVVVAATVGAAAHGDDPAGLGHLVVDLAQGRRHLVGEGAGDNHDVRLAGGGSENDSQAVLVVSWRGEVHHFDGAAGQTKGHGPK